MNLNDNELNVLYQSNNNYAAFMGVSITSLFINNKDIKKIYVYIIGDNLSTENITKLECLAEDYNRKIYFLDSTLLKKEIEHSKISEYNGFRKNSISYMKLFIDSVLPSRINRLLYIDCDTIIEGQLKDLTTVDMGNHPIGMVLDPLVDRYKKYIGFTRSDKYFNSGIILFDMNNWKKEKCKEKIIEYAKNIRVYGTVDQDFLNVVLKNKIMVLDAKYNIQVHHLIYSSSLLSHVFKLKLNDYYTIEQIDAGKKNPTIIHFLRFIGESPWHKDTIHPCKKYFNKYLALSPWKDLNKQLPNKNLIFKIEKILYKILPSNIFIRLFKLFHDLMLKKSDSKSKNIRK